MLEQTLELLCDEPLLAGFLCVALDGRPLPKPARHQGGAATDMFRVVLDSATVQAIIVKVERAAAQGAQTSGTRGRGLGGFAEAWREYGEFIHQQNRENDPMSEAQSVVLAMIDGFNRIDLDAIIDCFTEDALYHNIPMPAVRGKVAIRESLAGFMASSEEVQWEVLNLAADADVVLTERVDKFKINGVWVEVPVMGVFETAGGKIAAWRDYFDLGQFQSRLAAPGGE